MNEIWKQWEGQVVNGKFPLQKFLGGSGHGIVFLTERAGPGSEKAALKLMLENPAETETRLSVWAATQGLDHPNLLKIFEVGRCQLGETALLYVVMEHAEEDLSQILPLRALVPAEAQELIPPVVNALAYLHGKGFVHGHVRPTNIVAIDNQVKLSTDGLCAVAGSGGGWANYPGMDIFDPLYDPPEANGGVLTSGADTWSLGVTLVEALTLRRRIWDQTARTPNKEPELILPDGIPQPFLDIVRNCLVREPSQRWTSKEILARLEGEQVATRRQETATPKESPALTGTAGRKAQIGKLLSAAVVAAILIVVFLVVRAMRSPSHAGDAQPSAPASASPTPTEAKPAAAIATEPPPASPESAPPTAAGNSSSAATATSPDVPVKNSAPPPSPLSATGNAPGAVLQKVMPEVSQRSRSSIQGHVRVSVKVEVDASGKVVRASLHSPGPSHYFSQAALRSAQDWKFTPAQRNGQPVPSEWMLNFAFTSAGTDVRFSEATP